MEITLQISDSAYQQLMEGGKRIQGSVGLTTPHAGNFNEYSRRPAAYREGERVVRLRHGKARVNRAQVYPPAEHPAGRAAGVSVRNHRVGKPRSQPFCGL